MIELNAMHIPKWFWFFCILAFFTHFTPVEAQTQSGKLVVISPRAGEAVLGRIEISGISELPGFQRAEIEYRYTNDPKNTWFLIGETDKPVNPGKITDWDTSIVSDGNYDLRVTVFLKDGSHQSVIVSALRVRNYSPVETATPAKPGAALENSSQASTAVPTRTPRPTQPPYRTNPAVLTSADLNSSLVRGGIAGLGFFLVFGIYWIVKKSLS
jgi:hypothetical protein